MKSIAIVIAILVTTIGLSGKANAWGHVGHRVICQLAYDQLQNTSKREIKKMLGEMSSAQKKNLNQFQGYSDRAKVEFAQSCVWADAVRRLPEYAQFSSWHYVNVERDYSPVDSGSCLNNCVLEAIPLHYRVLHETKSSWDQAQALMFLAHWIGDIHQPLHVGFEDDRGGNMLTTQIGNYSSNFHTLWDVDIIDWIMAYNAWDEEDLAENVDGVNAMGFSVDYAPNSAAIWAEESRAIAQDPNTGYCRPSGDDCARPKGRPPYTLPETYYVAHWPQVRLRLKLASMRLAATIESAFAER